MFVPREDALTTVGLYGFGRIGRNLFRILYSRDDVRLRAISDVSDPKGLEYLLRFDTILGRFPDEVSIKEGNLYVLGRQIPFLTGDAAKQVPWGDLGVHTVFEATSRSRTRAELETHLAAGAKRVISLAPPRDAPEILAVVGVNDDRLRADQTIVSNASSTVHCIAPVVKILSEAFGIRRLMFTAVHSYTGHHHLADVPAEEMRRGRAAAENIIPQESRSTPMLAHLIPSLRDRLTGYALNVPVSNGSAVDLVCWHEKKVTPLAINEVVRTAAASARWRGVLQYEDDPIVSSDVSLSRYSSIFDSLATMTIGENVSKTICWYDAGYGYAHRAVDLVERFARLDAEAA